MKALIGGAGIGGLTAALCLQKAGWDVEIFEKTAQIVEVGAGLQLGPNAMRVVSALGLTDTVTGVGYQPSSLEMREGKSGRSIMSLPLGSRAIKRWGAPYVQIHRADLLAILLDAANVCGNIRISTGRAVTGFDQDQHKISAMLDDGRRHNGDILVGADGIWSTVREHIAPAQPPRFTGQMAWRAVVPVERLGRHAPPPTACVWLGPSRHAVTYLLRGGKLANFVGVVERADWREEGWSLKGSRAQALADFKDWDPALTTMIEQADTLFRWALFDRKPLKKWHEGRAILLGDACHPMLPFLAQGAAMAIEDAWVLASILQDDQQPIEQRLNLFAARRQPRTARVQAASRANATHFHQDGPGMNFARRLSLGTASYLNPDSLARQQDWLFGHDVTKVGT